MYIHYCFSRARKLNPMVQKLIFLCFIVVAMAFVAGASEAPHNKPAISAKSISLEDIEKETVTVACVQPVSKSSSEVLMSRGGSTTRTWEDAPSDNKPEGPPSPPPRVINTSSIAAKSNLTGEEFNQVIAKVLASNGYDHTKLSGIGSALAEMEQRYHVNGLFCLAVASYESGWGTSPASYGRNNPFGLISNGSIIRYGSMESCIDYWGSLIRSNYINRGRSTISSISSKYCPPNSANWASNVQHIYNSYARAAKEVTP